MAIWDHEPDEWGADLMRAKRHPSMKTWYGYVGIDKTHPLYGADMWNDRVTRLTVHGGVTWSAPLEDDPNDLWWFGFDCGHAWDYVPGFDMGDPDSYKSLEYVKENILSLAKQLVEARRDGMDD